MLRRMVLIATLGALALRPLPAQEGGILKPDIVYAVKSGEELALNLALPAKGKGPFPLIICVHGGAWRSGHRSQMRPDIQFFAANGYVAASIGYRFAPAHRFPAQLDDVKDAVRFLRSHASEYSVDPDRVGAYGYSAGGNLALLLALGAPGSGVEGDDAPTSGSVRIRAAVDLCGGSDFRLELAPMFDRVLMDFIGTTDGESEMIRRISPIVYVDKYDPPILSFYGDADNLTPQVHGELLHKALRDHGVEEQLVIIPGAGHGWEGKDKAMSDTKSLEFFDKHLKQENAAPANGDR